MKNVDMTNLIVFFRSFAKVAIYVSALFAAIFTRLSRRPKMLKSSLTTTGRVSNSLEFRRFGDLLRVRRHRNTLRYTEVMQTVQVAETLVSQRPNDTAGRARTFYHWCALLAICVRHS